MTGPRQMSGEQRISEAVEEAGMTLGGGDASARSSALSMPLPPVLSGRAAGHCRRGRSLTQCEAAKAITNTETKEEKQHDAQDGLNRRHDL